MTQRAIEVVWSISGEHYYVRGVVGCMPRTWAPIKDSGTALPFAFYELKSGNREPIERDHPLVRRYAEIDGWPRRGSIEWRDSLTRLLESQRYLLDSAKRTAEVHAEAIVDIVRELETP